MKPKQIIILFSFLFLIGCSNEIDIEKEKDIIADKLEKEQLMFSDDNLKVAGLLLNESVDTIVSRNEKLLYELLDICGSVKNEKEFESLEYRAIPTYHIPNNILKKAVDSDFENDKWIKHLRLDLYSYNIAVYLKNKFLMMLWIELDRKTGKSKSSFSSTFPIGYKGSSNGIRDGSRGAEHLMECLNSCISESDDGTISILKPFRNSSKTFLYKKDGKYIMKPVSLDPRGTQNPNFGKARTLELLKRKSQKLKNGTYREGVIGGL